MRASRGMGAIAPSKHPKKIRRKDGAEVDMYAEGGSVEDNSDYTRYNARILKALVKRYGDENTARQVMRDTDGGKLLRIMREEEQSKMAVGGKVKSHVNEAGNYTKPGMRKSLFNKIKNSATQGTAAGQWSARKAQLLAKQYKSKGGGYKD